VGEEREREREREVTNIAGRETDKKRRKGKVRSFVQSLLAQLSGGRRRKSIQAAALVRFAQRLLCLKSKHVEGA
jgi:ABC-type Mn2+/Zn2+ transport system ATPase subunit